MRRSLSNPGEKIVTKASEIRGQFPSQFNYDARVAKVADLPDLTAAQCKVLLDKVVVPNLADLKKYHRVVNRIAGVLRDELTQAENDPHYSGDVYEVRRVLRLVEHGGIATEGVPARFEELLAPMTPVLVVSGSQLGVEGGGSSAPPGLALTGELIDKLEDDRDYLQAFIARWPSAEATQPYRLTAARTAPYFRGGVRIRHGEPVQATELEARAHAGVLEPVPGSEAEILVEYWQAVNAARGGVSV